MFIFRHGCSLCTCAGSGMRDWNCFWFLLNFVKIVFVQHYQKTFKYLFLKCQLGLTNYSSCVSVLCVWTHQFVGIYVAQKTACLKSLENFLPAWKFLENFMSAWKFLENFLPAWKFPVSVIYYKFNCQKRSLLLQVIRPGKKIQAINGTGGFWKNCITEATCINAAMRMQNTNMQLQSMLQCRPTITTGTSCTDSA